MKLNRHDQFHRRSAKHFSHLICQSVRPISIPVASTVAEPNTSALFYSCLLRTVCITIIAHRRSTQARVTTVRDQAPHPSDDTTMSINLSFAWLEIDTGVAIEICRTVNALEAAKVSKLRRLSPDEDDT